MSCEALKQLERHNEIVVPKAAASALAAQTRIVSARELCVTLGKIIKISQRLLKFMARARISEFESYHPSHAVGLSGDVWCQHIETGEASSSAGGS